MADSVLFHSPVTHVQDDTCCFATAERHVLRMVVQMQVRTSTVSFLGSDWNITSFSSVGEHLDETRVGCIHCLKCKLLMHELEQMCTQKKKSVTEVRAHDVLLVVWMWTRHRQFQQFVAHMPLERMVVSPWSVADAEQMCTVI